MEYKQDHYPKHIEARFQKLKILGSGAYGYVWKVRDKKTNEIYALKKIFLAFQNELDAQRTYRQIAILKQISHPNVIKLIEVIKAENQIDLFLLFQYQDCDLFRAIKDGVLNDIHRKYIVYQIVKTLVYLHSAGILHRDLKPSNILIDSSCKIKICDFGLSRTLYCYDQDKPKMTQFIATRWYRAPQVLFGSTCYAQKSDIWSLGCLIYQIYCAKTLLPGTDSVNQIQKVLQFKGFPNQQQIKDLCVDGLQNLLSHFSTKKLNESHYFKSNLDVDLIEILKGMLAFCPSKRWDLDKVLSHSFLSEFRNYEKIIISPTPIVLKINDNTKHSKQFYRNFIYKVFINKRNSLNLDKYSNLSHHSSLSKTKRGSLTTGRKSLDSFTGFKVGSSIHHKMSKIKNKVSGRVARSSVDQSHFQNKFDLRSKNESISPYMAKLKREKSCSKLKIKKETKVSNILKDNSNKRKENGKEESKKQLKRKIIGGFS